MRALEPLVARAPRDFEARVALGEALYALGENARAYAVLDAMAEVYNAAGGLTPRELMWLGVGLHLTDYQKNANRAFTEAVAADPTLDEARLRWADVLISKWNFQDADKLLTEVLARRKDDPGALVGLARVDILSDRAFGKAKEKLTQVLAASPEDVPAHTLMAQLELENERPDAAIAILTDESLRIAPNDPDALALLAAAYYIADDGAAYGKTVARALAVNPRATELFTTVADQGVRVHRYAESIPLYERAAELAGGAACEAESPACHRNYWRALAGLGTSWSRVGDDAKAKEYLDRAFYGDAFDVRTYNLLQHFYDDVDKHFEWVKAGPIDVRLAKTERPVLERYVPAFLEGAWAHMTKKYGFKPKAPLHVEIFPDPETFAIRSTGLPQLGAHGICFGHVITARSPVAGDFNWGEVLWHELAHVFHIQLSESRVPRWFTEGLAMFESLEGRASWEREMDHELLAARRAGTLRGVADFNLSFTQAKSLGDILVAYYQAFKVAKFIDAAFGFDKTRAMLVRWGERRSTPEVFKAVLGVDAAEFDRRFFAWLDEDLRYLASQWDPGLAAAAKEPSAVMAAADAAPGDASAQAAPAVAAVAARDADRAVAYAEAALKLAPDDKRALWARAAARMNKKDAAGARADYEHLVKVGGGSADVLSRLARALDALGDGMGAAAALERALALDPKDLRLYDGLIDKLDALGESGDAYAWRKKRIALDQMNGPLALALLDAAGEHKASKEEVIAWGEQGTFIMPFSARIHVAFARELARVGDRARARFEAESALIIEPDNAEAKAVLAGLGG